MREGVVVEMILVTKVVILVEAMMLTVEKLPVMMVVEVEVMVEMMMKLIIVAEVELVVIVEMTTPSSPGPGKPEYLPREGAESVRRGRAPAPPWPPTSGPSPPRRPAHLARASRAGDGLIDLGKRQPSPPRPQPLAAAPAPRLQFLLPPARFLAQPGPGGGVLRGAPSDPRQQRSAAGDEI
ncbi:unnamed protein product [Rangifer tarandus platyrhynchus]|uniref:Uncharacterized protein n=3 Tax=Rangifer tarandus platyrhynchus TaxID=3082113 RepID=A0ABN8ZR83_RANTA|nr:unnamed protein product [Rangifer tarandus platyrhynchus]CAI9709836.1 unnamed protein product [Rangifer tarandus platyrhynchus]